MKKEKQGMLIAIEGIDGAGKSTLAYNIHDSLLKQGYPALLTKEPGATTLGKKLRTVLQESVIPLCNKAEYLLFAADRAQHFENIVLPSLKKGMIIISDRIADSSVVYQGYGRGLNITLINTINEWVMHKIKPNLTIYIRLSQEEAFKRLIQRERLSSFEKKELIKKVLVGFEKIYKNRNNDVLILDGTQSPKHLTQQAIEKIIALQKTNISSCFPEHFSQ